MESFPLRLASGLPPHPEREVPMSLLADRARLLDTENAFKIGPYIREVEESGIKVIKCNIGEPDFPVPVHIREEVKRQLDADNTHYSDPQGILSLRQAIARHIAQTREIRVTPERVVVFAGAKPPIGFCQQTYVDPGDEVIYPSPGFPIYESFTHYLGVRPVPLHLREETGFTLGGTDLEPLLTHRTKLIYLNFPSNPTGGVASQAQLEELAALVLKRAPDALRVYSDEVYEDILFDGRKHRSIATIPGMDTRTILVGGVSKSYCWTGGRVGWAVFPTEEEAQLFKNLNINYFSCVPAYNQEGAREALESPKSPELIRTMVEAFQTRRDFVVAALNSIRGIHCQNPQGAFYVFPNIAEACERLGAIDAYDSLPIELRQRSSPSTLMQLFLLFRYGIATLDRKSFGRIGSEGKHFLRLSIATSLDELREAMRRLRLAAEDTEGFAQFIKDGRRLY